MLMNITYYTPSNMAFANFDRAKSMQLAEFLDDVTQNLHNSKHTDVLIMDFSKVFDKVSHKLLMHKLKHYGIRGKINNCIESFLSGRTQAVIIEGEKSSYLSLDSGVSRGTKSVSLLNKRHAQWTMHYYLHIIQLHTW